MLALMPPPPVDASGFGRRDLPAVRRAHGLRRDALDAVARFRAAVDFADFAMFDRGASDLAGRDLARLRAEYEGPVEAASREVHAAIRAAHLAAGGEDFNCHVVDDAGDLILLEQTDMPLPDEESYFDWPYTTIRASKAIGPRNRIGGLS